jgi:hypothetical protein
MRLFLAQWTLQLRTIYFYSSDICHMSIFLCKCIIFKHILDTDKLDRSTALYIYKAKNCKLLGVLTHAQKRKFIFK